MDILSIIGIYYATHGSFPAIAARAICKLYVIALVLQTYQGLLYAAGGFFSAGAHKAARLFYSICFFAGCALIAVLPIDYVMEGRVVYSLGPSVMATYGCVLVFIGSSIWMAFFGSKNVSARRRWSILVWQGFWLIAAAIQFMVPGLLLVGFAAAFGVVLIYAELENPHEGIDRETGQFTYNALMTYADDFYRHKRPFSAMYLRVEYLVRELDPEIEKNVILRIANYFDQDKSAYVFRCSDDSFFITYPNAGQLIERQELAESALRRAKDMPVKLWYSLLPDSTVLSSADEFLMLLRFLEQKPQTADCIVIGEEIVEEMHAQLKIREQIELALAENRVEVFYQPIYDMAKESFTSAEALVRIRERDGRLMSPTRFIPAAEKNGQIGPLGKEVFRQVCEFLSTGAAQKLGIEYVEVNLSMAQFDDDEPSKTILNLMHQYRIQPSQINLEITETASAAVKRELLRNIDTLTAVGITFSLDDFGTGRSNLDYFLELPFSIIKFDYSFTQGYFRSEKARNVIRSSVEMINRVGLPVVAEGIETEEQLSAFRELGVQYIQGFFFSRPLPKEEFLRFLTANNRAESAL